MAVREYLQRGVRWMDDGRATASDDAPGATTKARPPWVLAVWAALLVTVIVAGLLALARGRADDSPKATSGSTIPSSPTATATTAPPAASTLVTLSASITTTAATTAVVPPVTGTSGSARCGAPERIVIPCPVVERSHVPVTADALPPLASVSIAMCVTTSTPIAEDCMPDQGQVTAADPAGRVATYVTVSRWLFVRGQVVDCAGTTCELRMRVVDGATRELVEIVRGPVAVEANGTVVDLGDPSTLRHREARQLTISGVQPRPDGRSFHLVQQCATAPGRTPFGVPYASCTNVSTVAVTWVGDVFRATIRPDRFSGTTDCAMPGRCWLTASANDALRVFAVQVTGAADPPSMRLSGTTELTDGASLTVTLRNLPVRRYASVWYCLDPERQRSAFGGFGDDITGCVKLDADGSLAEVDELGFPPIEERVQVTLPRVLEWYDERYDCADERGCFVTYLSTSDVLPDFYVSQKVTFRR